MWDSTENVTKKDWNYQLFHLLVTFILGIYCCNVGATPTMILESPETSLLMRFGNEAPPRKDYCDVNPVILHLRPPARYSRLCEPSQVISFGCRGQCRSYVEADPQNPLLQQRHCRCCEATRYGVHLASLPCRDGTKLRIALKFAMECLCRTCDELREHVGELDPMDMYTRPLETGLSSLRNRTFPVMNQI